LIKRSSEEKAPTVSVDPKTAKEATGTEKPILNLQLIRQAAEALYFATETTKEEIAERIQSTIAMLQGIKPSDEIEGMLATQMVAAHNAAMNCLRKAMAPEQNFAWRDMNLKHAAKLMSIYARQLDALNKHRGKGQQKVTVEHVHVEAGAQAVVGNVQTAHNPTSAAQSNNTVKAITHTPGKTLDLNSKVRVPAKQRNK